MTRLLRLALALAALALVTGGSSSDRNESIAALEVTVAGFPDDRGLAHLALYAGKSAYDGEGAATSTARLPIRSGQVVWQVDSLMPGPYAVRVFQDTNGNGALDTSRRGFPKEPFGFSNDPPPRRGQARWEDARFTVGLEQTQIQITPQLPPRRD